MKRTFTTLAAIAAATAFASAAIPPLEAKGLDLMDYEMKPRKTRAREIQRASKKKRNRKTQRAAKKRRNRRK